MGSCLDTGRTKRCSLLQSNTTCLDPLLNSDENVSGLARSGEESVSLGAMASVGRTEVAHPLTAARDELQQNPTSCPYCCSIPPPIHPFPILVCHFPLPFYTHLSHQVTSFPLHSCLQPEDPDPVLTSSSKLTLPAPILDSQNSSPSQNHSAVACFGRRISEDGERVPAVPALPMGSRCWGGTAGRRVSYPGAQVSVP